MTVYIWTEPDAYGSEVFEKELWKTVDKIIAARGCILTWLDNKRVLLRCREKNFNNIGLSASDAEKVAECDYMVCSWDGSNQARLKSVSSLLALGKKCRMFYIPQNKWVDVTSEEELKALEIKKKITYIYDHDHGLYDLPKIFWDKIDGMMESGDMFYTNSEFNDVHYYFMSKKYKNCRYREPASEQLPDFLNGCDRMVVVHDGEDEEAFRHMVMFLCLNKKCLMFFTPLNAWFEINKLEDLKKFVKEKKEWTNIDTAAVLYMCGFEDETISRILDRCVLSEAQLIEIVKRAPIPLTDKRDIFLNMTKDSTYEWFETASELVANNASFDLVKKVFRNQRDNEYNDEINSICNEIMDALMGLEYGPFILFREYGNASIKLWWSDSDGLFDSMSEVQTFVKKAEKEEPCFYKVEEWCVKESWKSWRGLQNCRYDYYFYKGEICWFVKRVADVDSNGNRCYLEGTLDYYVGNNYLPIPVPYDVGDMVYVNFAPFGPEVNALIIDSFAYKESWILYRDTDWDLWYVKPINKFEIDNPPLYEVSYLPLYRLRSLDKSELSNRDNLLIRIADEIRTDKSIGRAFCEAWYREFFDDEKDRMKGAHFDEVQKLWNSVNKEDRS